MRAQLPLPVFADLARQLRRAGVAFVQGALHQDAERQRVMVLAREGLQTRVSKHGRAGVSASLW